MAKRQQETAPKGQKIGPGNPPKHTRYRKGQSGNPKGRPKGSKNLSTLLLEAASQQVTATIDGRPRKISTIQATAMQLATKAASGNEAAMARFLDWIDEMETRAAASRPTQFSLSAPDIEVLSAIYERMKQCEKEKPEE